MNTVDRASEKSAASPELRAAWAKHNMVPLWEGANGDLRPVREEPRLWRWTDMRPILLETLKIDLPSIVERRVMQLVNDSIPGNTRADATSGLMNATLQGLRPGEWARPHRHTMNALRFVLDGAGAETIVNGKPVRMDTGDLVLTPAMTWHEHRHRGAEPTIWLDVLDVHLHVVLGTAHFQPGPIGDAPIVYADDAFSVANVVPYLPDAAVSADSPVFRYPWSDAENALHNAPQQSDGTKLVRYVHPYTGGPVMSLIDCYALELAPGTTSAAMRTNASAIVSVVDGSGTSEIDGTRVGWDAHDTLALPQNACISHTASSRGAKLFIATNREVYRRLGVLTEERVNTANGKAPKS